MRFRPLAAVLAALLSAPLAAAPSPPKPKLLVVISVDQFSADLFAEYRGRYVAGMKRLAEGAVFPSGYQGHAATETCPGHSTILTGSRPARTGIVANDWLDLTVTRGQDGSHSVYCAEDERASAPAGEPYRVSPVHLRVPTLGDRMKAANPASQIVSVAGKDRAAVMMGGHMTDQIWYWDPANKPAFVTLPERTGAAPVAIAAANTRLAAEVAHPPAITLPAACRPLDVAVPVTGGRSVGRLAPIAPGDTRAFRASGLFDAAVADLAIALAGELRLGRGAATDLLIVGLSANDYVGHSFGTEGAEMCAQQVALDATVGRLLAALDATGVPYQVVLTADHGGLDLPERSAAVGTGDAVRIAPTLTPAGVGRAVAGSLGLPGPVLLDSGLFGDMYLAPDVPAALRPRAIALAKARFLADPQVAAVFTADELRRMPMPQPPVDEWSLAERFRASFDPARSGDLLVALRPHVTPIVDGAKGYVATHGSPWNYDRRVPILFWRSGMRGFEQPAAVETVDILPTLAGLIGLEIEPAEIDGRCLDLDPGPASTCPPRVR